MGLEDFGGPCVILQPVCVPGVNIKEYDLTVQKISADYFVQMDRQQLHIHVLLLASNSYDDSW